ncbi:PAS sensor-containing signal transduction histidine kinase [Oleiphilus messinensis]|uniref:histidine kinase n=1 Tax=Oleiphilus messinensis TaxID=141451 RepID=A0A1Y0IBG9_9GAMM|nr:PAS domain S-box protein [Oleiphilus messinensis]ARU56754.1 PAS sensor-containing signal transduction histidine kinase [Oleiphilus messinensis]
MTEDRSDDKPDVRFGKISPELITQVEGKTNPDFLHQIVDLQIHHVKVLQQNEALRLSQKELSDSLAHYRALYHAAPIAYLLMDRQWVIHDANKKTQDLLELHSRRITGKPLSNFISEESCSDYNWYHNAMLHKGVLPDGQLLLHLKSVDKIVLMLCRKICEISEVIDEASLCLAVLIDITELKTIESALLKVNLDFAHQVEVRTRQIAKSREQLHRFLQASTDAIITFNNRGLIQSVNAAATDMFGFSENELVGMDIAKLLPEQSTLFDKQFINFVQFQPAQSSREARETFGRKKDKSHFPVSVVLTMLSDQFDLTATIRDMSARVDLEKTIQRGQEEERERIGRDLHDSVAQHVVGVTLKARSLELQYKNSNAIIAQEMNALCASLENVTHEIREIVNNLLPAGLHGGNLLGALRRLVSHYETSNGIEVALQANQEPLIFDPMVAIQLFRITQEAFQNAWSHSQATRIVISIEEQKERLSLSISDNGIGLFSDGEFPLQANHHGRGIANMFYRARLIGAHLKIESPEQGGTCIKCEIDNT